MRESIFTTEVLRSLRRDGAAWAYKIPDAPTSRLKSNMSFTLAKPFDIVACIGGKFVAIECKQIKSWKAFGMRDMRPSQVVNLSQVIKAGGEAYVFLNIRISRKVNRLVIFYWPGMLNRITAKELKELSFAESISRDGKIYFDLTNFVRTVEL